MCGRFTLRTPAQQVAAHFEMMELPLLEPRYNVAPTQSVPVVRQCGDGTRSAAMLRWGLVPFWADDPLMGNRLINARSEEVAAAEPVGAAAARGRAPPLSSM